jgi:hypothetical protein
MTQDDLNSIPDLAPLDSPVFIGTPEAPTQAPGTNSDLIATTAFVQANQSGVGIGQTWQNVTGSRASGSTYTNDTGKPISVSVFGTTATTGAGALEGRINGVLLFKSGIYGTGSGYSPSISFIVPAGNTYSCTYGGSGGGGITVWAELR